MKMIPSTQVNQESFSRFQAFLDDVRDKNTAPPRAALHSYKFYLKWVLFCFLMMNTYKKTWTRGVGD
jgi:hypothetical protein